MSFVITNARLLDPATNLDAKGSIKFNANQIAEISINDPSHDQYLLRNNAHVIDAKGLCLAPGLVDMRVQTRSNDVDSADRELGAQAAFGGVTSIVFVPNHAVPLDNAPKILNLTRNASHHLHAHYYCYGALTQALKGQEMAEMGLMLEAGAVGFTDGVSAVSDAGLMYRILRYSQNFNALIIQHPEEPSLANENHLNAGSFASMMGIAPAIKQSEVMMIERDLRLVEATKARYHAAHISTSESIEAIMKAKKQGYRVSCDTQPAYFTLNDTLLDKYQSEAKFLPPLRTKHDQHAMLKIGLAQNIIDAVGSDHIGCNQDEKRLPFMLAKSGASGLISILPLMLKNYHDGHMTLLEALSFITYKPAKLLGIQSGQLKAGLQGDVILFDLDEK
ncbi:MAG: dihydroorotase, partial [Pseudomonadota bacterium]